jgi:glyoxylase-like metal-dependent hydrolase (beta-lactamase superfamily II)
MIVERGKEDWESEFDRFPRLFQGHESIPGLTWPTLTFHARMSLYLGRRRVDLMQLGRAHTAGDIVAHVPSENAMFSGDIVEYKSACYCGDAHFGDWPGTLDAIARIGPDALSPGRGDALVGRAKVGEAIELTRDFLASTYAPVARVALAGGSLKEAMAACRAACDVNFGGYAIYEHCLPFNVARAYDEALGLDTPRIWTAARDKEMWAALQG